MNGTDGEQGPVGAPGLDGRNGSDGSPGPPGTVPDAVIEQLREDILEEVRRELKLICPGDREMYPATSCKEIYQCNSTAPSGYYWVRNATGQLQVFCDMDTTNCGNITGGWMRVAYIDMTNPANTCPENLTYTVQSSTRMCRSSHTSVGCSSVTFPGHRVPYTKVCGRARGYHYASPSAFEPSQSQTIEGYYVEGVSVTHGSPRNHIWTFAAGLSKDYNYPSWNCPLSWSSCTSICGREVFLRIWEHWTI